MTQYPITKKMRKALNEGAAMQRAIEMVAKHSTEAKLICEVVIIERKINRTAWKAVAKMYPELDKTQLCHKYGDLFVCTTDDIPEPTE